MAPARGILSINNATCAEAHARARAPTPTHPHTHTCGVARMRTQSHLQKYVILIAFPRQLWFRERASMLRYTYIACLVFVYNCAVLVYLCFD